MDGYLKGIAPGLLEKAKNIKMLVTDVDGVLTDGGIIYDSHKTELKKFNVKDGLIVQYLKSNGVRVGIISGRDSQVVKNRCEELAFDFHLHGIREKRPKLEEILRNEGMDWSECAFIGDDLWDLPILSKVGLSAAPADALSYVREKVDFVCSLPGGKGAFRELSDLILMSKGRLQPLIQKFSDKT